MSEEAQTTRASRRTGPFFWCLLTLVFTFGGIPLAISLMGNPVGVPSPKVLTPLLFTQIQIGDSRDQVERLLPNPRPAHFRESHESIGPSSPDRLARFDLIWREFGVCSTYSNYIEFRIGFKDGKVITREQKGP